MIYICTVSHNVQNNATSICFLHIEKFEVNSPIFSAYMFVLCKNGIFRPLEMRHLNSARSFFSFHIWLIVNWNCNLKKWFSTLKNNLNSFSDVDTPEPDEKSIITYVSQLYDVFPEPPAGHPLFDVEAQKRLQQFRDLASSLHQWIKEQIVIMQVCLVLYFYI